MKNLTIVSMAALMLGVTAASWAIRPAVHGRRLPVGAPVQLEAPLGLGPLAGPWARMRLAMDMASYDRRYTMSWQRPRRWKEADALVLVGHVRAPR